MGRGVEVPPARRESLQQVLDELADEESVKRKLPRRDVPTVVQLVTENRGISPGRLGSLVNRKRRETLRRELTQALRAGAVREVRVDDASGRRRVRLEPGPSAKPAAESA